MEENYCVYRHLKPNGEVFYIGRGINNRPYCKINRSRFWKSLVNQHPDYEVQILKSGMTFDDANELETILIAYYGRRDLGLGTLVNLTNGGDGSKGAKLEPQTEQRKLNASIRKINEAEQEIKFICIRTLKTFGSTTLCAEYAGINLSTFKNIMNPNSTQKNNTTIMKYADYLEKGTIEPEELVNKKTPCIHTLTKEIFKSSSLAAKAEGIPRIKMYNMLFNPRMLNKTYIVLLSDYTGEVHYPELEPKPHGIKVKYNLTGEVYTSIQSLAKHLNVHRGIIVRRLRDKTGEFEYV